MLSQDHVPIGRRVSFDPLALLLDASLEGELELVVKTAGEVGNVSAANDEGITALHNAICAGHFDVVRFLVQFGCDVNAQDSDGWYALLYINCITLFYKIVLENILGVIDIPSLNSYIPYVKAYRFFALTFHLFTRNLFTSQDTSPLRCFLQ